MDINDIKDTVMEEVTEKIEDLATDHADMIEKMPDAVVEGAENLLAKVGIDVDLNGDETTTVEEAPAEETETPAAE
jgi:hypothetical protein